MLDIRSLRLRHSNAIRNTPTGRSLGEALDEVERLRVVIHAEAEHHDDQVTYWSSVISVVRHACDESLYHTVRLDWLRKAMGE